MTSEHRAKMIAGLKRYHQRRRYEELKEEEELRRIDEQNVNQMFATKKTFNVMQTRIQELESRLSKYEPIYA
jgi:transcription elongation GreA/GreB family factor